MDMAKAVALAQRLITANGRKISVVKLSGVAADPTKPWRGAGVPTALKTVKTSGVFLSHASNIDLGKFITDLGDLMKRVEQAVLIPGGVDLSAFDQIIDGAIIWKIDWTRELKPGTTTALYAMGVKR